MNLAIIGTAGRGEDGDKLTLAHWFAMRGAAKNLIQYTQAKRLVSGGAAWADHVAVSLSLEMFIPISLYLPGRAEDKETALRYYNRFERVTDIFAPAQISATMWVFGNSLQEQGTFKERNELVARRADQFLAMTFGHGPNVKDGGTGHTVGIMRRQGKAGWHLDLNTFKLHRLEP